MTATATDQPTSVIDPSGGHRTPKPAAKRASRATRATAQAKDESPSRPTATKPAPAKAPKDPGTNEVKNKIADALIEYVGATFATADVAKRLGVSLDVLKAELGRTLSYAPGSAWHKSLTSPGTGRGKRHSL